LQAQRRHLAQAERAAASFVAPIVPQMAGTLAFICGAVLLVSGATPALDARLATLRQILPLPILELSHLAGSVAGVGLLLLSRALFQRVAAAYHAVYWLLAAGR
jgi:phosphatidylglycerol lysyltransferase